MLSGSSQVIHVRTATTDAAIAPLSDDVHSGPLTKYYVVRPSIPPTPPHLCPSPCHAAAPDAALNTLMAILMTPRPVANAFQVAWLAIAPSRP